MNRQAWRAVIATGLVLAVASLWSGSSDPPAARGAVARPAGAAVREVAGQAGAIAQRMLGSLGDGFKAIREVAPARLGLQLGALALALAGVALWLVPGPPRGRVLAMVARGVRPSRIARRTGFSQDAIRALLQVRSLARPAAPSRKELPAGKIVRRPRARAEMAVSRKSLSPQAATVLRRAMTRRHEGC